MSVGSNKKVWVGLSGGVDSSVSAALLKDEGYDVTGVFIKVWHPDFLECGWKDDRRDAMRVCAHLNIPFKELVLEEAYKKHVVDYMVSEYKSGRTPNPDVMCNRFVKFGAFLSEARQEGVDFVATGHYSQVKPGEHYKLFESNDKNKDQSYFLWQLTQAELADILFPIGHLTKPEVRALADKKGLLTAAKRDSQGLCFIGHLDLPDFLSHFIDLEEGDVLSTDGNSIGRHKGAVLYTLGQRHGFQVHTKTPESGPFYVVDRDTKENTITVSEEPWTENEYLTESVTLESVNWVGETPLSSEVYPVRYRYRQRFEEARIALEENEVRVLFLTPQTGAAEGQSLVVYKKNGECLGGGIIKNRHAALSS